MENQPYSVQQRPLTATGAMDRLICKAKELVIRGHTTEHEKRRIADAVSISRTAQKAWKRQKYKLFLCGLLESGGPHLFLLCAIALGQVIVANMKQQERARLRELANNDTQLAQRTIRDLAIQHQIPVSIERELPFKIWNEANQALSAALNTDNGVTVSDLPDLSAFPGMYEEQAVQAASQPTDEIDGRRE